jgi:hypothetical protein
MLAQYKFMMPRVRANTAGNPDKKQKGEKL